MVHDAGEIGVGKCDAAKRSGAQNFARRGFAVRAEEETRLRIQVSVSPAIEDDASDVALGIEASGCEHSLELLADAAFDLREAGAQQFGAPAVALLLGRHSRIGIKNFQGQHDRRIRADDGRVSAEGGDLSDFYVVADAFEPAASRNATFVEKLPVAHGDV